MRIPPPIRRLVARMPARVVRRLKTLVADRRDRKMIDRMAPLMSITEWERPPCALCGASNTVPHTRRNGFDIVCCRADGLIYNSPRPVDLAPFYDDRYYTGMIPGAYADYQSFVREHMTAEWTKRLETIEKLRPVNTLLDVGSATGDFLAIARSRGWETTGIELSQWAAQRARDKLGLNVLVGTLPDARLVSGTFAAVTMWDCIEHLAHPHQVMRDIRRLIHPDGVLMLSTGAVDHRDPRVESGWYAPPWHLYYFSRETIFALLEQCSFTVTSYEVRDPASANRTMVVLARPV
jgi:2-polyprenyl-3-methyl-5-hydroxy-6-metoxy-1,4-benzoquinol methylase